VHRIHAHGSSPAPSGIQRGRTKTPNSGRFGIARAVLEATSRDQAADAQYVKWLMEHQRESDVFTTVSTLVDILSDSPAAKLTAQQILERIQRSQQARPLGTAGHLMWQPFILQSFGFKLNLQKACYRKTDDSKRPARESQVCMTSIEAAYRGHPSQPAGVFGISSQALSGDRHRPKPCWKG
jgi:hypothetical protein